MIELLDEKPWRSDTNSHASSLLGEIIAARRHQRPSCLRPHEQRAGDSLSFLQGLPLSLFNPGLLLCPVGCGRFPLAGEREAAIGSVVAGQSPLNGAARKGPVMDPISIKVVERVEWEEAHLWFDGGAEGVQEGVPE